VTNPRDFERPETMAGAWKQVEEWLDCKTVWTPLPTDQHRRILSSLLSHVSGKSNLVPDAHLAALAIEHGLVLCSADRGYARFPNLRWENPLAGRG
jgi:hypothetical protein